MKYRLTTIKMTVPMSAGGMTTTSPTGTLGEMAKQMAWKFHGFTVLESQGRGIVNEFGNGFQFESIEEENGSYYTITVEIEEVE